MKKVLPRNKQMKKMIKADLKILKKQAKYFRKPDFESKNKQINDSKAVRFAHIIKGTIYIILAVSLLLAIILGQTGVIITLDDLINNLILALAGKIILGIIAIALFIYGLKQLYLIR